MSEGVCKMTKCTMEERAGAMLMAAAGAGDLTLLKHMSLVFDRARNEKYHEKALEAAVLGGQLESVKLLLAMGVDPNGCIKVAEYWGQTAILHELTSHECVPCDEK